MDKRPDHGQAQGISRLIKYLRRRPADSSPGLLAVLRVRGRYGKPVRRPGLEAVSDLSLFVSSVLRTMALCIR